MSDSRNCFTFTVRGSVTSFLVELRERFAKARKVPKPVIERIEGNKVFARCLYSQTKSLPTFVSSCVKTRYDRIFTDINSVEINFSRNTPHDFMEAVRRVGWSVEWDRGFFPEWKTTYAFVPADVAWVKQGMEVNDCELVDLGQKKGLDVQHWGKYMIVMPRGEVPKFSDIDGRLEYADRGNKSEIPDPDLDERLESHCMAAAVGSVATLPHLTLKWGSALASL